MARQEDRTQPSPAAARVYSYIRFSTSEQSLGDSERRQLAAARAFAEENGLPFDESLCMTDRGMSAYRGEHRKKGALRRFLELADYGQVPHGSRLVVENIDRLSREAPIDALKTILYGVIEHDIAVVTLDPFAIYDRDSLNDGGITSLLEEIKRAHRESERKSKLQQAAWNHKREQANENGSILTARAPAWLAVRDRHFEVIPKAAEAVRMIFKLKLSGMGKGSIVRTLNAEAPWTPPKSCKRTSEGWRESYVAKILSNRGVLGEYQPCKGRGAARKPEGDLIPNYYPPIVKPDVFHAVQALLRENRGTGGPTGQAKNLLTHLVKCAYCSGSMAFISKGKPPKGAAYLVCDNGRRGVKCRSHRIRYDECEVTVLENCLGLRPEQVLPAPEEQAQRCKALRGRLSAIDGLLADIGSRCANLMDQIERASTKEMRDRYEARIVALDAKKEQFGAERKSVEQELRKAESSFQSFEEWQHGLADLRKALKEGGVEFRLRLRAHLRQLIDKVQVFAVGFTQRSGPDGIRSAGRCGSRPRRRGQKERGDIAPDAAEQQDVENLAEYICEVVAELDPAKLRDKRFHEFLRYVTERRMSKDGRFLRIHFKTGATRDVVPAGSIADGHGLEVDEDGRVGWRVVRPNIDELRRQYEVWARRVQPSIT